MNYKNNFEAYIYVSKIFFFIFIIAFTYVILINVLGIKMECEFKKTFHRECASCGLTRGIFQCIKSNYYSATKLNINSVFYFLYALWQILIRAILVSIPNKYLKEIQQYSKYILFIDLCLTVIPIITYYLI
jgi:hypothetical protein